MTTDFMSVVSVLERAQARVKRGWCQNAPARNSVGMKVPATSPNACEWCASGAINAAATEAIDHRVLRSIKIRHAFNLLREVIGKDIVEFNDASFTTQEMIVLAFSRAIGMAKARYYG